MIRSLPARLTALLLLAPLGLGCEVPDAPGGPDGGTDLPDATLPETDGGEPVPPVVRTLVRADPLGGLPVENRVLDPGFALTSFAWVATELREGGGRAADLQAVRLAALPAGRGAVEVLPGTGDRTVLAGLARGGPGDLRAEVWIGYRDPDVARPVVALVGNDPETHADRAVDLHPQARRILGDVVWEQYGASVPGGLWGWAALTIDQPGPVAFLAAGAVVVSEPAPPAPAGALVGGIRPPSPAERAAGAALRAAVRERLWLPPEDPRPHPPAPPGAGK